MQEFNEVKMLVNADRVMALHTEITQTVAYNEVLKAAGITPSKTSVIDMLAKTMQLKELVDSLLADMRGLPLSVKEHFEEYELVVSTLTAAAHDLREIFKDC